MVNNRFSRLLKILTGAEGEILHLDDWLERWVHFWVLVKRQFVRNRCLVRAEALSYSTLLALIPLLAIALWVTSIALKNKDDEQFYRLVDSFTASVMPPAVITTNGVTVATNGVTATVTNAPAAGAVADATTDTNAVAAPVEPTEDNAQKQVARQIRSFVQNTNSGTLGTTGTILLLVVAISMLGRIEATFNDIWGVTRGRRWTTQIPLYIVIILFGPMLLLSAVGLAEGAHFQSAKELIAHMPIVGGLVFKLLPPVLLWLVFGFIYLLVPNTKVSYPAAFFGALVGGSLWQLNNLFGYLYVSRVAVNYKIYGGFGLLPVFMIGLYFSWCILLLGAQVAYAFQNRVAYLQDRLAENVNQRGREFVALRLMAALGQRFQSGQLPGTVQQLSTGLGVPSRLTQAVLRVLLNARLVTEVAGEEPAYAPARPLDNINVYDILHALRTGNGLELPACDAPALAEIYGEFARVEQAERDIAGGISLQSLVNRVAGVLPAPAVPVERLAKPVMVTPEPEVVVEVIPEPEVKPVPPPVAVAEEKTAVVEKVVVEETVVPVVVKSPEPVVIHPAVAQPEEQDFPL